MRASTPPAFSAVADPTRRAILDLLAGNGPMRAGEIAWRFRAISRPAVSRHLRVLRRSRLVRDQVLGREHWYRCEGSALQDVHDWVSRYRPFWEGKLDALDRLAAEEGT